MASLYRRGKVWWAKSYRDGRIVRVSLKTQDRREARDRLKELEARHASRLANSASVVPLTTWDDAARALMEHYRIYGTRHVVEAGHRVKRLPSTSADSGARKSRRVPLPGTCSNGRPRGWRTVLSTLS